MRDCPPSCTGNVGEMRAGWGTIGAAAIAGRARIVGPQRIARRPAKAVHGTELADRGTQIDVSAQVTP